MVSSFIKRKKIINIIIIIFIVFVIISVFYTLWFYSIHKETNTSKQVKNNIIKNYKINVSIKSNLSFEKTNDKKNEKINEETNKTKIIDKQDFGMNILVPAYFRSEIYWNRLIQMSRTYPNRIYAIVNPHNGPGDSINKNYKKIFLDFSKADGNCIGYVSTKYGERNINDIKSDIDKWYSFYNPGGIFLDEQSNKQIYNNYYQEIYNYIKSKYKNSIVIGNAGTKTTQNYITNNKGNVTDVICIFESENFDTYQGEKWFLKYPSDHFYILTYNTPNTKYKDYIDKATKNNIKWIYCTNDTHDDNPWDTLPDYFEEFCIYAISS